MKEAHKTDRENVISIWNTDPGFKQRLRVEAGKRGHKVSTAGRAILELGFASYLEEFPLVSDETPNDGERPENAFSINP